MGFYPAQRTLQLSSLFSQSLGPHISGLGWRDGQPISSSYENSGALAVQSMLQPYYAPGILYNTVKSGIACDWGAYTSSFNAAASETATDFGVALSRASNYRIPFESILDPLGEIGIPTNTGSLIDKKLNLLHMNPGAIGKHGFHNVRTMLRFEIKNKKIQNLEVIEFKR